MFVQATQIIYSEKACWDDQSSMMLYKNARVRGRRGQLLAFLTGRSRKLHSLEEVSHACKVQNRRSGGTRTVPIAMICGSENRAADFDCDFNPLQDHTCDRWLNIAKAWQRGRYLPPVILIQVGDHYFVRDGHHRISVARALGMKAVEAKVEVWILEKSLSEQSGKQAPVCEQATEEDGGQGRQREGETTWKRPVISFPC